MIIITGLPHLNHILILNRFMSGGQPISATAAPQFTSAVPAYQPPMATFVGPVPSLHQPKEVSLTALLGCSKIDPKCPYIYDFPDRCPCEYYQYL